MRYVKRSGFTLVEILVVLAIVVLLASILFAVFARVRENGRNSACQSNLRQLSLAYFQYMQDSDGRYPSDEEYRDWLSPYVKNTQIFFCPSCPSKSECPYQYNTQRLIYVPSLDSRQGRQESSLPQSTKIWLQADLGSSSSEPFDSFTSSCGTINAVKRHFNGSNYSFLDGHVKWLTAKQYAEIECSLPPAVEQQP